MSNIVGEVT